MTDTDVFIEGKVAVFKRITNSARDLFPKGLSLIDDWLRKTLQEAVEFGIQLKDGQLETYAAYHRKEGAATEREAILKAIHEKYGEVDGITDLITDRSV